jgi:hypothetical protein
MYNEGSPPTDISQNSIVIEKHILNPGQISDCVWQGNWEKIEEILETWGLTSGKIVNKIFTTLKVSATKGQIYAEMFSLPL